MKKILSAVLVLIVVMSAVPSAILNVSAVEQISVTEGIYTIQSMLGTKMMLDISGGSKVAGGNVQIYHSNSTTSQMFWIQKDGSEYTITAMNSGLVLDVKNGTMKSGTNVQQYTSNNSAAQKWKFYDAGNGYCYIACGQFALDVSGGRSSDGTNVQIYTPNWSASQKWKLKKVNYVTSKTSYSAKIGSGCCVVKVDSSLINKSRKQYATVKLNVYNGKKTTSGYVLVTLTDMAGNIIWSGKKCGGDTLKLGDDYSAYKIYVSRYDSGSGVISGGNDFINAANDSWSISNVKNGQIYSIS